MADTITINPGDYASTISQRGGFTVKDLINANPDYKGFIKDPTGSTIYAGDTLNLPKIPELPPAKSIPDQTPTMPADAKNYDIPPLPGDNTDLQAVIKSITGLYGASGDNTATKEQDTIYTDIKSLLDKSKGKEEYQATKESELGVPKIQKDIQELTNQITQLGLEQTAQELQIAKEPISAGAIRGRNIELERNNAIKALTLSAQIQAKQGNLQIAQDQANRAVDLKYKSIEDELNNKLKVYELNKDILSREDSKRGVVMNAVWQYQLQKIQDKKEEDKKIAEYAITAAKNGAPNNIVSQIQKAGSSAEALNIVSKGGYLKSSVDILEEENKRLQNEKLQKEISLLGEPTVEQKKKEAQALKSEQGQMETLQGKVNLIDAIKNSGGLSTRVGTNVYSRVPVGGWQKFVKAFTPIIGQGGTISDIYVENSGKGQQFSGGVHQLASQEFLDALINAKAQGATFGALTDREGDALRAAATKINDWEIKDKSGKGIGVWNIDEKSFTSELDRIKDLAQKAITRSQGNLLSEDEKSLLDSLFKNQDASFYFQ